MEKISPVQYGKMTKKGNATPIAAVTAIAAIIAVLATAGEVRAQGFVKNADGYTVTHTGNNGAANNSFDKTPTTTSWAISGESGLSVSGTGNWRSFFTLKKGSGTSEYTCKSNGTYTVEFGTTDPWRLGHTFTVFRYTDTTHFYAVMVTKDGDAYFYKNGLDTGKRTTLTIASGSKPAESDFTTNNGEWTIEADGNKFTIKLTVGTKTATYTYTDTANPNENGQVGYANSDQYNIGAKFFSSSWKDATPPPPSSYKLTVIATNGTVSRDPLGTSLGSGVYQYPASPVTTVTLTPTPATGYRFLNWSGGATGTTSPATVVMNKDTTVTANFGLIPTYKLTVVINPTVGGTVDRDKVEPSAGYDTNTVVTLTAKPATGYTFKNWTGGATGTAQTTTVTMNAAKTVTAVFELEPVKIDTFTLKVIASPATGGEVTPAAASGTKVEAGVLQEITATPLSNYEFTEWKVTLGTAVITDATKAETTVKLSTDATVTAVFTEKGPEKPKYKLTVSAGTGGTISAPAASPIDVDSGAATTITAVASAGYAFSGWSADPASAAAFANASNATTTVALTANAAVKANFINPQDTTKYTLTINVVPDSTIGGVTRSNPELVRYPAGTVVTVSAAPKISGWKFDKWSGALSGGNPDTTILMDANKTITATFVQENLTKLIAIDSAVYLPDSMVFKAYFRPADGSLTSNPHYTYELTHGSDTVASSAKPVSFVAGTGVTTTIRIPMTDSACALSSDCKSSIEFESTYAINVRVVSSDGNNILSSTEREEIEVGDFKVQKVVIPAPTKDRVARVDNDRFRLATKGWRLEEDFPVQGADKLFNVTVRDASGVASTPDDFIKLSKDYRYRLDYSLTGYLKTPFTVSIRADSIPKDYGPENVKLYRYVGGAWAVVFDMGSPEKADSAWYITGKGPDLTSAADTAAYRLMINKKTPEVVIGKDTLSNGSGRTTGLSVALAGDPVTPGSDNITVNSIRISSNVSNTTAKVMYAAADDKSDSLKTFGNLKTDGLDQTQSISIHRDSTKGNITGLLVYLIIDNGTVSDTINMSRSVRLASYRTETQDYHRGWSPFGVGVTLDSTKIDKVFRDRLFSPDSLVGDGLPVDNTVYRLVRWLPKANGKEGGDWTEYDESTRQTFLMSPGRLMWLRTKSNLGSVDLGTAVTASLTEDFRFRDTLKSMQWTDFILPFGFKVRVKDILAASSGFGNNGVLENSDSLYFYVWEKNGTTYNAKPLYRWSGIDDADTAFNGPFTVYNAHRNKNIILRVPPKPAYLSPVTAKLSKSLGKSTAGGGHWHYTINVDADEVTGLASLRIGSSESERVAPAPPTLGGLSAVILSDDGWQLGDFLTPELLRSGRTFKLRFINSEKQKASFKFSAAASAGVPERMQIMFVDAATGEVLGGSPERSITVAGNSYSDVYAVVGSRDYLNKTTVGPSGAKFAMGRVAVNQAARSVRVQYYVPLAGTDRVEMSVYNLKGRLMWKNAERVKQSSWNTMEWKSRESRGGAAATGLYIIRVRAINASGKTTAVENRKITFAR